MITFISIWAVVIYGILLFNKSAHVNDFEN